MYLGIYYKFPIVQTIFKIQFLKISTLTIGFSYSKLLFLNALIYIPVKKQDWFVEWLPLMLMSLYAIKLKLKQTLNKTSQYIAIKIVGIEETVKYILNNEYSCLKYFS